MRRREKGFRWRREPRTSSAERFRSSSCAFGAPPDQALLDLAHGAAGNPLLLTELICGLRDDNAVQVTDGHAVLVST
ncbi:MAG TPA: hypothetical protein VF070_06940 [Streptosporangiaceae bacterium]